MTNSGIHQVQGIEEIVQEAPVVFHQEISATPTGTSEAAHLLKPAAEWTWSELRDYVITEIERRFGKMTRNPAKEAGIIKSFIGRYGVEDAVLIAMAAYEVYEGVWRSAPVRFERFTKGNDQYFSNIILARLKG